MVHISALALGALALSLAVAAPIEEVARHEEHYDMVTRYTTMSTTICPSSHASSAAIGPAVSQAGSANGTAIAQSSPATRSAVSQAASASGTAIAQSSTATRSAVSQAATASGTAVAQSSTSTRSAVSQAASASGTAVAQSSAATRSAVSQAATANGTAIAQSSTATRSAVSQAASASGTAVAQSSAATRSAASQAATANGTAVTQAAMATGSALNRPIKNIQPGVRPYFLVNNMTDSPLKRKLQSCSEMPFSTTDFTVSHRGAALQFPEHTVEGRAAAARQGAGIIECDITFTKDQELVCRHSQCDLHTSTNILLIPELAAKCNQTFVPAANGKPASAQCCTSDITLAEFKTLCGKQDGFNASATNVQDYQNGTPNWRTDLYSTCGTVTSHKDYIQEINRFGLSYTPETKAPLVQMPFQGNFTQDMYVQKAVNEYKEAGIHPSRVWFQSFLLRDVLYWIKNEPEFAKQAMYLDDRVETDAGYKAAVAAMQDIANQGVKLIAPAFPYLLAVDNSTKKIVPSDYAIAAQKAGLKFITWSFERSGPLAKVAKAKDYYYSTILDVIKTDGQMYEVLDVLAQQVKIVGFFSDWPATITYYANCMGLKGGFADADRN
ncbi:hypothetical protein LTR66_003806 [Elasticomyces elasticus]|nr:hypothetical protein LTR66_003806 [Elasticomyces elasticus]